jgi:hypothetical protein
MTRSRLFAACSIAVLPMVFSIPASAGIYGDELGKCLVKSTTTADKNTLVKWLFSLAALHPDLKSIASISAGERDEINKSMGAMFERLLTVSCKTEAQQALQFEGTSTFESGFQILGQVAGHELFSDPQVSSGMDGMLKYIDQEKIKELAPQKK